MSGRTTRVAGVTLLAAALTLIASLLSEGAKTGVPVEMGARADRPSPASSGRGSAETLLARYRAWETAYERAGGDRALAVGLAWSKGLSTERSGARGRAVLDLPAGTIAVDVRDIPAGEAWDVWIVDDRTGTVLPEPGDALVRVGTLRPDANGRATLRAALGAAAAPGFEVDFIFVARAGRSPTEERVLAGSTTVFHALQRRARLGRLGELGDGAGSRARLSARAPAAAGPQESLASLFRTKTALADIGPIPNPTTALQQLVNEGRRIFLTETFDGNGRTCNTCHREDNNFTIDPEYIAKLPSLDPLFVAENNPALAVNFEKPAAMREIGLILTNVDGFDDLPNKFVLRSVPHLLALIPNTLKPALTDGTTIPPNERVGWGGDLGTLRDAAIGMIVQHFPKTLGRVAGVDYRLPTVAELDGIEAHLASLGRPADVKTAGPNAIELKSEVAKRGQQIFNNPGNFPPLFLGPNDGAGKCLYCHHGAGAGAFLESVVLGGSSDPGVAAENGQVVSNGNYNTGVGAQGSQPATLLVTPVPPDGGFGLGFVVLQGFGDGTFNTPPLVEAADTAPYFHHGSASTLEGAIAHYPSPAFANSPTGNTIGGIDLDASEIAAVAAFLRVLNALENIRSADDLASRALLAASFAEAQELLALGMSESKDAEDVLHAALLHPKAQTLLGEARSLLACARANPDDGERAGLIGDARDRLSQARDEMVMP